MQFLASFHIVLVCSFVLLLAYLISTLFTYLAHSFINGSHKARTRTAGSSRSRRTESFQRQQQDAAAVMARLQDEDESEDAYHDAELRAVSHTSKYEMGGSIDLDDAIHQEYYILNEKQASLYNKEGMKERGLDVADIERYEGGGNTTQLEYKDSEDGHILIKGGAGENGLLSSVDNFKEGEEEKGTSSKSVLGDAQGSSSLQQRLPPTWADLERIVKMSSKKHSAP